MTPSKTFYQFDEFADILNEDITPTAMEIVVIKLLLNSILYTKLMMANIINLKIKEITIATTKNTNITQIKLSNKTRISFI